MPIDPFELDHMASLESHFLSSTTHYLDIQSATPINLPAYSRELPFRFSDERMSGGQDEQQHTEHRTQNSLSLSLCRLFAYWQLVAIHTSLT